MREPWLVYRTGEGVILEWNGSHRVLADDAFEELFRTGDAGALKRASYTPYSAPDPANLSQPISRLEVWAAGVTYLQSRTARMEDSRGAGGGNYYDQVYEAKRPELFFKTMPHRIVGHRQFVRICSDSDWNVPEPELTLAITGNGKLFCYTIGNDMSSWDIEGVNPLYLPQANVYKGCAALGPGIYLSSEPLDPDSGIAMEIRRNGTVVFEGGTKIREIKRTFDSLIEYLFRDNEFPAGCFLMSGIGGIPPDEFSLRSGDEISITIKPIGTLVNYVL